MAIIKLQGDSEKKQGIYYEFDDTSTPLGEGGMGKVFRGRRINVYTHETRDVAIKFMFSGLPQNVIQRAEDEANIKLQHENLVEMMGFLAVDTKMPNGVKATRYHVVSELLIGVSLSDLIQGVVTDQNGVAIPYAQTLYKLYNSSPEQFAVTVVKKVLSGIMALHDAGYIHRDIDPSNVMVTRDGKIKLIDFGIAKKVDGLKTHDRNLTTAGQFMGKPQYAAPELIIGDLKNQNKPTDIYALGVLLFQLAVGHLPYEGPSNVVLNAHLRNKMPLQQVESKGLRNIIAQATEKDCTKRYQTAAEFRAALDNFSMGRSDNSFDMKKISIIGGIVAAVIVLVVCLVVLIPKVGTDQEANVVENVETTDEGQQNVSNSTLSVPDVRKQLLNPSEAKKGLVGLKELVASGNIEAKFILSRLYAVSSGSFTLNDDFVTMQANLKKEISQSPSKAHSLLGEIVKADGNYYPALYELACDYYEGPSLTGGEARNLRYAKDLLDKAYKYASEAEDPVYVNKISALLRKY